MRSRTDVWKNLAENGAKLQTIATIGGKDYEAIASPMIERGAFSELSIGNVVSATLQITIRTDDTIPKSAEVVIKSRFVDGSTTSEWKQMGVFYVSSRSNDVVSGLISLTCYDAMLKANRSYTPEALSWPRTMTSVVDDIANTIGVDIDARTSIKVGADYVVQKPTDLTMMQVLSYIASANGGNFVLTPENKLRLVPLAAYDASSTDKVNVYGITSKLTVGKTLSITGVSITNGDTTFTAGNDDGFHLAVGDNPYATQNMCNDLFASLGGLVYQEYAITGAVYDPCSEIGDVLVSKDDVKSVLWFERSQLNVALRGELSAPTSSEITSEYPYKNNEFELLKKTVLSVVTEYYLSDSNKELKNGSWSSVAPENTGKGYLWSRTVTTYANGAVATSEASCIASQSEASYSVNLSMDTCSFKQDSDGKTEAATKTITVTVLNGTETASFIIGRIETPTGGTFTVSGSTINFTSSNTLQSGSVTIPVIITDTLTVNKTFSWSVVRDGEDGRGVESVERFYKLSESTPTKPTAYPADNTWSKTEPTFDPTKNGKLYYVDCTVFKKTNETATTWTYSDVQISSSYEAARLAYEKAESSETLVESTSILLETLIRQTDDGVEVGKIPQNGQLGNGQSVELPLALVNANGTFDVYKVTFTNNNGTLERTETTKMASFGTDTVIGVEDGTHAHLDNDSFDIVDDDEIVASLGGTKPMLRLGAFTWINKESGNLSLKLN